MAIYISKDLVQPIVLYREISHLWLAYKLMDKLAKFHKLWEEVKDLKENHAKEMNMMKAPHEKLLDEINFMKLIINKFISSNHNTNSKWMAFLFKTLCILVVRAHFSIRLIRWLIL